MDISGESLIPASRETVWAAINDPDVLKDCIPGCQSLTPTDEGEGGGYTATVRAKIGPLNATFSGGVRLEDVQAPESYTLIGEGKGGAAGFAKGRCTVHLAKEEDGTRLTYTADAQVGGKMAQLGSRLVQGTARKYADDFFRSLTLRLSPAPAGEPEGTEGTEGPVPEPAASVARAEIENDDVPRRASTATLWGVTAAAVLVLLALVIAFGA